MKLLNVTELALLIKNGIEHSLLEPTGIFGSSSCTRAIWRSARAAGQPIATGSCASCPEEYNRR